MIYMLRFLKLVGLGCITLSCQPTRHTRDSFQFSTYCYNGNPTGPNTLIETRGYYKFEKKYIRNVGHPSVPTLDTLTFTSLFLNDGTFIYNFIPDYFEATSKDRFGFYNRGTGWGRYQISGDTIKAQFIESPGGMSWEMGQIWFQIIDKSTIRRLCFQYREPISQRDVAVYQQSENGKNTSLGHFVKYDNLPDSNKSWLKRRRWFWCSEDQYTRWKLSLKE